MRSTNKAAARPRPFDYKLTRPEKVIRADLAAQLAEALKRQRDRWGYAN